MTNKSVGATIFGWAELIISLRALLFTVPVLLNKKMTVGFGSMTATDWFFTLITLSATLFLLAGLISILGNKLSTAFHIIAVVLVVVMTLAMTKRLEVANLFMSPVYYLPAGLAVVLTAGSLMLNRKASAV